MTNPDLTLLAVLVDRSGSMADCRTDMEGGLNQLLGDQSAAPGQLDVTLAQFDTVYERVWETHRYTGKTYTLHPRGGTALLDGMGRFITEIGEELAHKPENERPGTVIMLIVTDGEENSSREWTKARVKALVDDQRASWKWEFIFLGAGMDAVREGHNIGVTRGASLTFDAGNPQAVGSVYAAASAGITGYRATGKSVSFSEDDRSAAMGSK